MAYTKNQRETIFNEICRLISEEGKSLRSVLLSKDMPDGKTFYKWREKDNDKAQQYAGACEARADLIFEDILHIADDTSKDTQTVDIEGVELEVLNKENIQRARLRVDARKWVLSKMNPKKYGDASLLKIADQDGNELKVNAIFTKDILQVPSEENKNNKNEQL